MSALIVTAEFGRTDFAWLDGLRRAHYPPERNRVPAHLTLFHALPPSAVDSARRQLALASSAPPPRAMIAGLMKLGGGVAFRVVSEDLDAIRADIADHFHGMLGAQDAQGWRPHVTIQNKASAEEARTLFATLDRDFEPRALEIAALALHRYVAGPWETVGRYPFRGAA
ncbi:2'-5' RNA ligase family protein [Sphingomonas xanthus]|uniref:2'-5' RNA ligase family protein n=2 Tax=Sphingomonas xanthus TaxID=2594473 RepID=A0A516IU53_9SPHN|nr:2'-5' RNA ligase family protein [Sphingomonas xanthus]